MWPGRFHTALVERLTKLGMDPTTRTPESAKIAGTDYAKWGPVVKASGLTTD